MNYYIRFVSAFTLIFLLMQSGCSNDSGLPQITGTVTWKGQPLNDFLVNFKPDEGRPSVSGLEADGKYEMLYTLNEKGVSKGKHKVYFTYSPQDEGASMDADKGKTSADVKEILKLYGSEKVTPIEVEITESQELNFDLPIKE